MILLKLGASSALVQKKFDGMMLTRDANIHTPHDETDDADLYYALRDKSSSNGTNV